MKRGGYQSRKYYNKLLLNLTSIQLICCQRISPVMIQVPPARCTMPPRRTPIPAVRWIGLFSTGPMRSCAPRSMKRSIPAGAPSQNCSSNIGPSAKATGAPKPVPDQQRSPRPNRTQQKVEGQTCPREVKSNCWHGPVQLEVRHEYCQVAQEHYDCTTGCTVTFAPARCRKSHEACFETQAARQD